MAPACAGSFDIGPFTVPAGADKAKLKVRLAACAAPTAPACCLVQAQRQLQQLACQRLSMHTAAGCPLPSPNCRLLMHLRYPTACRSR